MILLIVDNHSIEVRKLIGMSKFAPKEGYLLKCGENFLRFDFLGNHDRFCKRYVLQKYFNTDTILINRGIVYQYIGPNSRIEGEIFTIKNEKFVKVDQYQIYRSRITDKMLKNDNMATKFRGKSID